MMLFPTCKAHDNFYFSVPIYPMVGAIVLYYPHSPTSVKLWFSEKFEIYSYVPASEEQRQVLFL